MGGIGLAATVSPSKPVPRGDVGHAVEWFPYGKDIGYREMSHVSATVHLKGCP